MAANKVLKNFNLTLDGYGFAGELEEVQLPELTLKTEDFGGGGMDGSIKVEMGMEPLEMSFTTTKHCAETLKLFGVVNNNAVACIVRAALEDLDGTVTAVTITMRGKINGLANSAWSKGSKVTQQYKLSLQYYKYVQGDITVYEVDIPNMVRIVNGTDQLKAKRDALGIA
jgi:hypothetical protein